MKVHVQGAGEVSLTKRDFIYAGGEGEIYGRGSRAYKIFYDPKKMIAVGKIADLAAIANPDVIKPEHVLADDAGRAVGYDMRLVRDAVALCSIFPPAYRDRVGLTHAAVGELVQKLRAGVADVHQARVLVVDLNELNFVLSSDYRDIYFIDVDSYQTQRFPATAIMDSIRDPKCGGKFTEGSDWFSFAVVICQMFVGIHPYKGRHPSVRGMVERMAAQISIFNKDVGVPGAAYPVDVIPKGYRAWLEAVLEHGERSEPPRTLDAVVAPPLRAVTLSMSGKLDMVEFLSLQSRVRDVFESGGAWVALTDRGVQLGATVVRPQVSAFGCGFTQRENRPVAAGTVGGKLVLTDLVAGKAIDVDLAAEQAMVHEGRVYVKQGEMLVEVDLREVGERVVAAPQHVANCMVSATRLYRGVAVQNMLGSVRLTLFPASGTSYTVAVKELDGARIIDARCCRNVVMVAVADKQTGDVNRWTFRFDSNFECYSAAVAPASSADLNFVVTDAGVVACLEDETLRLSSAKIGSSGEKVVDDAALAGGSLGVFGGKVIFWRGDKVYKLSVK